MLTALPLTRCQAEILASHLTIGETYFFRDRAIFTLLETQLLPALIRSRRKTGRRLRIWSAACCTGEEPYSIAILLSRLIPDLKDWSVTVLGTDINPYFLARAAKGVYRDWSFRDTPPWIKEGYFQRTQEGDFQVLPPIKDMVTFSYLNLAEDGYPSPLNNIDAFDIIFCRNVLMYFEPGQAKKVIQNLHHALVEGGYLIVSPSETSNERFSGFATVNFPGAILYQKGNRQVPGGLPAKEQAPFPDFGLVRKSKTVIYPPASGNVIPPAVAEPHAKKARTTLYDQALRLFEQCRYGEAVEYLLASLETNPEDAQTMALLARAYASQGQLAEALTWCQKTVTFDKFNPRCRYLLATILQELNRLDEAATALTQTLYLDPHFAPACFALGNLTLSQGKSRQAQRHFQNALSILQALPTEEGLPEADGLTAGRLIEIIRMTMNRETIYETEGTHQAHAGY
jgi:chemotaxis protein methyltransferase CheR